MLDRDGDLRAIHTNGLSAYNLQSIIGQNVEPGSVMLTDEHTTFVGLSGRYTNEAVYHSAGDYVRKFCIHTNGIDSVWALLKRQIIGIFHWVSSSTYLGISTK